MNCLTAAGRVLRDVEIEATALERLGLDRAVARAQARVMVMDRMDRQMEMAYELQARMKATKTRLGLDVKARYFVTVRPDAGKIDFPGFQRIALRFAARACMLTYELVFEQKGVTPATLGEGFHAHFIVDTTLRSKADVLRAACSTFGGCTAANCVQVDTLRSEEDVARVRRYIYDHDSKDGHKETTREWDALWRSRAGVQRVYESSLSSPDGCSFLGGEGGP